MPSKVLPAMSMKRCSGGARRPPTAISVEALLVWPFRAQRAELEPPRDRDRDRPAVGTEERRRAGLHHRLLAPHAAFSVSAMRLTGR
jgi:hypothetical protein